eukprot:314357-Prorocentrum_lima.AAC.1
MLSIEECETAMKTALLQGERATLCRSELRRAAYLAQDRADLSEVVKCLSRHMSQPREAHLTQPKRLA